MAVQKRKNGSHYKKTKGEVKKSIKDNASGFFASFIDLYNIAWPIKGLIKVIPLVITLLITIFGLEKGSGWRTLGIYGSIAVFVLSAFDMWASAKKDSDDILSTNAKLRHEISTLQREYQKEKNNWDKEREKLNEELSDATDAWERYESTNEIRKSIATAEAMIYEKRNRPLVEMIDKGIPASDVIKVFLMSAREPRANIDTVFDELCSCFAGFTHLERSDIPLAMIEE